MKSNIGLRKIISEIGSAVLIENDARSSIKSYNPRVTRTPTLDGGSVIYNLGYSDGDREITIISMVDPDTEEKLRSMVKDELFIVISTRDGVFYGSIESLQVDHGNLNLKFLAQEKDDA